MFWARDFALFSVVLPQVLHRLVDGPTMPVRETPSGLPCLTLALLLGCSGRRSTRKLPSTVWDSPISQRRSPALTRFFATSISIAMV